MLKFFKDLSFTGGVLFLSTLFLGLVFRIIGLNAVGAWGDEVASWYFARHLGNVFFGESHTPVYYFLCKIWYLIFPESILSLRYFSIFLSLIVSIFTSAWVGRKKDPKTALVLFILWWLWPTMIIYSRQGRHYSLYLDLSLLIIVMWNYRREVNKYLFWGVLAFYQSIHPLAAVVVSFLVMWDFLKEKDWKDAFFKLSSVVPVAIYYLARLVNQGGEKVYSNIGWISQTTLGFIKSFIALFYGDSFPFSKIYPVSVPGLILLTIVVFLIVIFKSRMKELWEAESLRKFVAVVVFTEVTVEVLGLFGFNLRVSRYFIYAPAMLIYALGDISSFWSSKAKLVKASFFALCLSLYAIFFHRPWEYYSWDDENVASFKLDLKSLPKKELVVCGSAFQLEYYFNRPYLNCSEEALNLFRQGKSFYIFDINGNDKLTLLYLHEKGKISLYRTYEHAILVAVGPK